MSLADAFAAALAKARKADLYTGDPEFRALVGALRIVWLWIVSWLSRIEPVATRFAFGLVQAGERFAKRATNFFRPARSK